jgi:hypothetical protein
MRAARTMPDFKRARRQGPLVVENAQVRGGSLQVEVPVGVATALRPPEEPADFEMPSALDSRTPRVESTDSCSSNDIASRFDRARPHAGLARGVSLLHQHKTGSNTFDDAVHAEKIGYARPSVSRWLELANGLTGSPR